MAGFAACIGLACALYGPLGADRDVELDAEGETRSSVRIVGRGGALRGAAGLASVEEWVVNAVYRSVRLSNLALTRSRKLNTALQLLQQILPCLPRLYLDQELFAFHHRHDQLGLHWTRDNSEMTTSQRRIAKPQFRHRPSISDPMRLISVDLLGFRDFFFSWHVFADEEQVGEHKDVASRVLDVDVG